MTQWYLVFLFWVGGYDSVASFVYVEANSQTACETMLSKMKVNAAQSNSIYNSAVMSIYCYLGPPGQAGQKNYLVRKDQP